ncbi:MAG: UDP-2,3-diacylglucosamine diphosphatase LpxI [Thermodesulfobacteriota bacterium]
MKKIGIIAGGGSFPSLMAEAAKKAGMEVSMAAYIGHAEDGVEAHARHAMRVHLGELSRLIAFFRENGITRAAFAGSIDKTRMYGDLHLDERALSFISQLTSTRDDAVMRGLADELQKDGITIVSSTLLLPELIAPEGCWTARQPGQEEAADIEFAYPLAKKIGELDIGQTLCASKRSVLAVEGMDGTDATILRAGTLCKGGFVVVKVKKPVQDERFDLPAAGEQTIRTMIAAGATALAIEAGNAVIFDRDKMVRLADEHGISIVGKRE